jgi:hypothetical protein
MRATVAAAVVGLSIAALLAGCPTSSHAPCVEATCRHDCELVGLSSGACAGGVCQCAPPSGPDADADPDADLDADADADAGPGADAGDGDVDAVTVLPECGGGGEHCANDWFLCWTLPGESPLRHCEGQAAALGGEPGWACEVRSGAVIACTGPALPAHVVGFECVEPTEGDVRCNRHLYTPAERPAADWACRYERAVYLVCESTGSPPPPENCCVAGAWRYCDTPTYCNWGVQACDDDGLSWGSCVETSLPAACAGIDGWYSPASERCCIDQGYCCQDMWDLDVDGDSWESLGACDGIVCAS